MDAVLSCCLCRETLSKDKRRRRKLHGPSCSIFKAQMQSMSSVSLESLVETGDKDAYLCSSCETQLKSIGTLEVKLAELKSQIKKKLSNLHSVLGTPADILRKRQLEGGECDQPAQKQPRTQQVFSCTPSRSTAACSLRRRRQALSGTSPVVQV